MLVGGLLALAIAVAYTLSQRTTPETGSNRIQAVEFVAQLPGGKTLCQSGELVPPGSASLEFTVGTYGRAGPPVRATITRGGRPVAAGGVAAGWREGNHVRFPIEPAQHGVAGARVCLANAGAATLAIGGNPTPDFPARVNGAPARGRVHIVYLQAQRRSWWSRLSTIWHRFGLGKAPGLGSWTLALAVLLTLAAIGAAAALLIRGRDT